MVATSSFQMKTLNEAHIEQAGEFSRVPAAMLRRTTAADNGLDSILGALLDCRQRAPCRRALVP
jgi:hypothetical protein